MNFGRSQAIWNKYQLHSCFDFSQLCVVKLFSFFMEILLITSQMVMCYIFSQLLSIVAVASSSVSVWVLLCCGLSAFPFGDDCCVVFQLEVEEEGERGHIGPRASTTSRAQLSMGYKEDESKSSMDSQVVPDVPLSKSRYHKYPILIMIMILSLSLLSTTVANIIIL